MSSDIPDRLFGNPRWAVDHYGSSQFQHRIAQGILSNAQHLGASTLGSFQASEQTPISLNAPRQMLERAQPANIAQPSKRFTASSQRPLQAAQYRHGSTGINRDPSVFVSVQRSPVRAEEMRSAFKTTHGRPQWMITPGNILEITNVNGIYRLYPEGRSGGSTSMFRTSSDFSPEPHGVWLDSHSFAFKPPMGRTTLPKTLEEYLQIVVALTEAVLNTTGIYEDTDARAIKTYWEEDSDACFQAWQADAVSRKILDTTIRLHNEGYHEPNFDRGILAKVNPFLGFDERINCLIILFSKLKSICEVVMKNEKIMTYVAGPIVPFKNIVIAKAAKQKRKDDAEKRRTTVGERGIHAHDNERTNEHTGDETTTQEIPLPPHWNIRHEWYGIKCVPTTGYKKARVVASSGADPAVIRDSPGH